MVHFTVQVKTREEERFIKLLTRRYPDFPMKIVFPRRNLTIRRMGKLHVRNEPLFPGYIFLEGRSIDPQSYWAIRRTPGFFRFLKSNHNIQPLEGADRNLLLHFLNFGEIVQKSLVQFDSNDRIVVLEGPLVGLEGRVVKVDKRKKRVKIKLDLYNDSFLVDLGIEMLARGKEDSPDESKT